MNGIKSKYNEIVKEIKFAAKQTRRKGDKAVLVKMELTNGHVAEIYANRAEVDLIKTLKQVGVEIPVTSFQIEQLQAEGTGAEYHAIVLRIADKRGTWKVYMIPFETQSIMDILLEHKGGKNE